MAGYIGSKAVLLSTTAATVTGDAQIGGDLTVDTDTLFVDAANNRVGVGTISPDGPLTVQLAATNATSWSMAVEGSNTAQLSHIITDSTSVRRKLSAIEGFVGSSDISNFQGGLIFKTTPAAGSPTERMRIDASGNLLVGKTDTSINTQGVLFNPNFSHMSSTNDVPLALNRKSSDGEILNFRKDGTTVGSIGVQSSDQIYIGTPDGSGVGLVFDGDNRKIDPTNGAGSNLDNAVDLGNGSHRFNDIYATNGTIQTSDRNEKQDIEVLSDAEQRVAVACKGLLRKFRWKDAVAEKGDDARIHFGIIAQDLQDAFAAEGLDAGRYAMFISSTWWETQTEVPAVEAVAAVDATYDEDGNELTPAVEAVEAKDAYTRTDTYETLEETPEGATERTRLGVRYPELLAFIIGAM